MKFAAPADAAQGATMAFRILSLDGGGTWALIQIRTLQKLYGDDAGGLDVLGRFDLVAANSGGAIVLGGLLAGMTLAELLALFESKKTRRAIFHDVVDIADPVREAEKLLGIGARFSTADKRKAIGTVLGPIGDVTLDRLQATIPGTRLPRVLIPAFDYDLRRATLFRSDLGSLATGGQDIGAPTLADAIHASSTAPVHYFDAPATVVYGKPPQKRRFWDGAVGGYDNPVLAAVIEVRGNAKRYRTRLDALQILSIGTGGTHLPLAGGHPAQWPVLVAQQQKPGAIRDVELLATSILDDPPDAATFDTYVLLGQSLVRADARKAMQNSQFVRMNPMLQPSFDSATQTWVLTGSDAGPVLTEKEFRWLLKRDLAALAQRDVERIAKFCESWFAGNIANQPIIANAELQCVLGHATFGEAMRAWEGLCGEGAE
jgi:uncharacterized protein